MAAPELAELAPGAQGMSMVGTFLAEQVSNATFELVSVPFFALQRRKQAGAGRSPTAPASARGRRQRGQDGSSKAAVVLPALIPIDPLLDEEAARPGRWEAWSGDAKSARRAELQRRSGSTDRRHASAGGSGVSCGGRASAPRPVMRTSCGP